MSFCLEDTWIKTKIQDFRGLLGEPFQMVHTYGEDNEVALSFT